MHQDLALNADLDVVDNLALGQRNDGRRWLSDRRERSAARALLNELAIDVNPDSLVRELAPAQRTMVAIARALRSSARSASLLVLDEVSAWLPETEARLVFALIRKIRDQGGPVLYVTHRLEEVFPSRIV